MMACDLPKSLNTKPDIQNIRDIDILWGKEGKSLQRLLPGRGVFVSQGCRNKVAQTDGLEQLNLFSCSSGGKKSGIKVSVGPSFL